MKKSILALLIIFVFIIPVFTGCQDETGLTKEERVKAFVKDLNNPLRSDIYKKHFAHSSPSYGWGLAESILSFPPSLNYSVASISSIGPILTVTITGASPAKWTFTMVNESKDKKGDDWYIFTYTPFP